jgi:hypothetical protein
MWTIVAACRTARKRRTGGTAGAFIVEDACAIHESWRETPMDERRHESVDHEHPTDAGMMDPDPDRQPATGIMGDETLVRLTGGGIPSYPGVEGAVDPADDDARPGPTNWDAINGSPVNR